MLITIKGGDGMSSRDGRGPANAGPGTGRGLGSCGRGSTIGTVVGVGAAIGYGLYKGRRGAGSRGRGANQGFSLEQEKNMLVERLDQIKELMGQ